MPIGDVLEFKSNDNLSDLIAFISYKYPRGKHAP